MKGIYVVSLFLSLLLISGCKKDDPKPLQSEVHGRLLAGEPGKSKTWIIVDGTYQLGTADPQSFTTYDCVLDNIYTFTNDAQQAYEASEGATKCNPDDPDVVESGSWAFTADGKTVFILSNNLPLSSGSVFSTLAFAYPAEVMEISEDTFTIKMTTIGSTGSTSRYIFYFEKM